MIIYHNSAILNRRIKTDTENHITTVEEVYTPSKDEETPYIEYSLDEVKIIEKTAGEITPLINCCKKVFHGEVVNYEKSNN